MGYTATDLWEIECVWLQVIAHLNIREYQEYITFKCGDYRQAELHGETGVTMDKAVSQTASDLSEIRCVWLQVILLTEFLQLVFSILLTNNNSIN